MSRKAHGPDDIYDDFYDNDFECIEGPVFEIGETTACTAVRGFNLDRQTVHGFSKARREGNRRILPTRAEAEQDLHDNILELVHDHREEQEAECDVRSVTCDKGDCYLEYQIDERRVRCRMAQHKSKKIWVCTYEGRITHRCVCLKVT